ncbi:hypothetical protein [Pseudomonas luteola]|uniref:hypothetical protein n=1 Tax=Pseudomonas luteola TaxID=47886 RepID=UPI0015E3F17A|nr:hypothetical protein [Pseudomonas zeshuii]MBA1250962.1 hypothetical protein [Pseudomonas zeshuii]
MSKSCNVEIINNSGRSLDAIAMWHTSMGDADYDYYVESNAVITGSNVSNGQKLTGKAQLDNYSPTDYWYCGVRFHGDGENYQICSNLGAAGKEYEVSDGSTITFTINNYSEGTPNQNDVTIQYSGDEGGKAFLLNHTTMKAAGIASSIGGVLAKLLE